MTTQLFRRSCAAVGVVGLLSGWWALSAPAVHAATEVTVTPATGLVDLQEVQVQATGMPPWTQIGACQTIPGADDPSDCAEGTLVFGSSSSTGTVSFTITVRRFASIPSLGRTLDCADPTELCTISAARPFDIVATLGEQLISFGPPPPPPATRGSIAVSPDDRLAHGDVVTVVGSGFRPNVAVVVEQCVGQPSTRSDCIEARRDTVRADASGSFSTTVEVLLGFPLSGTIVDCLALPCTVAASEWVDFTGTIVTAPLGFEPREEPTIAVTPDEDLRPGDVVTVSGANFLPGEVVRAGQCHTAGCAFGFYEVAGPDGSFHIEMTLFDPGPYCPAATASCRIRVEQPEPLPIILEAPIAFAPPPPVVVPGGATVVEGDGATTELHVPVSLSAPSAETVTVPWRTIYDPTWSDLAAVPRLDYAAASGVVTFAPGTVEATATILIHGDDVPEADELLVISFHDPTNARMGGFWGLGFGAITDDD